MNKRISLDFKFRCYGALRSVMARFFPFFKLFHLSLTFFRPEVPFKDNQMSCDVIKQIFAI